LIHFFNAQGKYQVPVYQADVKAMVEIVVTYKNLVPGIRVTQHDEVVFETDRGTVIWPEISTEALAGMREAYPSAAKAAALDVLQGYMKAVDSAVAAGTDTRELTFAQLCAAGPTPRVRG
jgi:hypothetical protein